MHVYEHWHTHVHTIPYSWCRQNCSQTSRSTTDLLLFTTSWTLRDPSLFDCLHICMCVFVRMRTCRLCVFARQSFIFYVSARVSRRTEKKMHAIFPYPHPSGTCRHTHMNLWDWPELAHANKSQICHCLMTWEKVAHSATINCWCRLRLNTTCGSITSPWET